MASLGKDLAYIRKEQNKSLDDIYQTTKIPKRVLRSIEDDSIFEGENPIYIRSYIRTYAKALSIEEEKIIYALNKKEKNDYSGSLQELLENKPPQPHDEDDQVEETPEDTKQDEPLPQDSDFKSRPGETEQEPVSEKPNVRSVDWVDMGRQFQPLKKVKSRTWIGVFAVFLLLVVSGVVFYFYFYSSNLPDGENQSAISRQETPKTVRADSLNLNVVSPENNDTSEITSANTSSGIQNETLESLPDTLNMVLYAAYGKLEPVRVYTDIMDNINPYWIEQGEALRFNFVNDIQIRGQFSRMVLLLNGHLIQNFREEFYNPDTRLIEINRSYFEGDSQWLQPAPDSLAIDAPTPTIKERPTFN